MRSAELPWLHLEAGLLRPVLARHNAVPLEDVLYIFEDPCDAMSAAISIKTSLTVRMRGES